MVRTKFKASGGAAPVWCARPVLWLASAGLTALLLAGGAFLLRPGLRGTSGGDSWSEALGEVRPSGLNVILITVDTLRTDRLSVYGSTAVQTPNIDALAREGVLFTNAASTVPLTLPAHISILTGTYPPFHGVRENVGYVLDERTPVLAGLFKSAGWATAAFVSAYVLDAEWGTARGFDRYFDDFDVGRMKSADLSTVRRPGDETVAEAVRWLDTRPEDRPFFLWLHLYDPHDPYRPPEPYRTTYAGRPYDGTVAFTDAIVGTFRQALRQRGLLDRSLLVFTADHGEGLGDHGEMFHGYFVYDATIHVPLIIRTPTRALAGRVVTEAVSHVDLLPTVLEAAHLQPPAPTHGTSLLPLMQGAAGSRPGVYSESFYPLLHYGWAPLRALRTKDHKLIDVPRPELYDIVHDRREQNNLADTDPALARSLRASLGRLEHVIAERAPDSGKQAGKQTAPNLEALARLRSLGYVAGTSLANPDLEGDGPRADPKDKVDVHQSVVIARNLIGRGDSGTGLAMLTRLVAEDPRLVEALEMLGALALERGRFSQAAGHFRQALAVDADRPTSLLGLADACHGLGRDEEALTSYRRVLELSGGSSHASFGIARILLGRDQPAEAATALETALEGDRASAALLNALGELRAGLGRRDEALALFQRAIAADDRLAAAHFNLGRLYGEKGDTAGQQASWEAAVKSNPDFATAYIHLGKLLMDRGQLARAEELTRTGLEKDPSHATGPLGYYVLADILNRTGRRAEAQRAVRMAESIPPVDR